MWFWLRREIPQKYKLPLVGILALGGVQGVMGWLMVASGLVDNPAVSHYRLAAHLLLAVALYVSCLWMGLVIRANVAPISKSDIKFLPLYKHSVGALWLVIITLTWGAFVAGLRAGLIYNTWPLMDGHIAPPDFWFMQPWWINFFENHGAVQFTHRCLAYLASIMCISIGLVTYLRKVTASIARWGYGVAAMGFFQPMLGIITVLTQVKIHAAVAHQAGAFVLIGLLVIWCFELRRLRRDGSP
jgi:cytochrome c oxidase assembly protein subunit 15